MPEIKDWKSLTCEEVLEAIGNYKSGEIVSIESLRLAEARIKGCFESKAIAEGQAKEALKHLQTLRQGK